MESVIHEPVDALAWGTEICSRSWMVESKQLEKHILLDDIFRAMTRQVQYMAIHCTPKMKELNLCTNT